MRIARWGNSLAIRLPAAIVEALSLKESDDVEIHIAGERAFDIARDKSRERALERIRALRKPIPPGWKFDREESNERRPTWRASFSTPTFWSTLLRMANGLPSPKRILVRRCDTSVQALNEFANVARRKLGMNWAEVTEALAAIRALCGTIHPLDLEIHQRAMQLAERHGFPVFDALIVAAALKGGCAILHSEDMQDGMEIEGQLQIRNPFKTA